MLLFHKAYRRILTAMLGIEHWHASGAERHPYRQEIVRRLQIHEPDALLDVGCGLGDILCRVSARRRLGGDVSARVLWAARLSHPWHWLVHDARFRKMGLGDPVEGCFDAVVCVNFIHMIAPIDLRAHLRTLVRDNLATGGLMVFDVVRNSQYLHNHDSDYLLQGLGLQVEVVSGFEFGRSLVFAKKLA